MSRAPLLISTYKLNILKSNRLPCQKYSFASSQRLKSTSSANQAHARAVENYPNKHDGPTESSMGGGNKNTLDLSFSNHVEAFKSKKTWELFRALCILKICSYKFVVEKNSQLMKFGQSILGDKLFSLLMKQTFFGQFVAGENEKDIKKVVDHLKNYGVKSILDYSAEEDISSEQAEKLEMEPFDSNGAKNDSKNEQTKQYQAHREFADRRKNVINARTYFYLSEAQCEKNMEIFLRCIKAVSDTTNSSGLAAIKMTALGNPKLLMQMSEVIIRSRNYYRELSGQNVERIQDSFINRREFEKRLEELKVSTDRQDVKEWLEKMDYDTKGLVHIFSWSGLIDMNYLLSDVFKVPNLQSGRMESFITALTNEEEEMFKNMMRRLHTIARTAREEGVRVMIDAEQTYFQPAISCIAMELMRKYNKNSSIIFNTYQCYLKNAYESVKWDLELAKRQGFYFGAKLVRGAYMEQERERAKTIGYEDPINPDYQSTNEMYNNTLLQCFGKIKETKDEQKVAIMVASHNEDTVRFTVQKMEEYGIRKNDRVICFGQLYGMCDQISFMLGQAGYSVYKYLPYGPVKEVLPYLSRRAQENSSLLKNVDKERGMIRKEFFNRLKKGKVIGL